MSLSDVAVQQYGHLAAAPEMSYVGQGEKRVARTTMVVISNKIMKDQETGETRERTTSIRWTLWRQQAENAAKFLSKGSAVLIAGRVENNNYERTPGDMVYDMQFTVDEIKYLDSKAAAEARAARQNGNGGGNGGNTGYGGNGLDDDIPM